MDRSEIKSNLLGMSDLAARWNYRTVSAVRKRRRFDKAFPEPLTVLNGRVLVFWLPDIEAYENLRPGIGDGYFTFRQTKEEWGALPEADRNKRHNKYRDK